MADTLILQTIVQHTIKKYKFKPLDYDNPNRTILINNRCVICLAIEDGKISITSVDDLLTKRSIDLLDQKIFKRIDERIEELIAIAHHIDKTIKQRKTE